MTEPTRPRGRRALGALLLAALVVLAGCSGAGGDGGYAGGEEANPESDAAVAQTKAVESGEGGDGEESGPLQAQRRQVIRTGEVVVTVADYGRARRNLSAAARALGGFVSDSTRRRHEAPGGTYVTGSLTLRVPRDRFDRLMQRAEATGTVRSSATRSRDVTDRLVDLEARLDNLRAERDRLRTLYDRANDTEAVLDVQERLSEVQGEIERIEARQQTLERQVAYSTVTVELREERPGSGPGDVERWYDVPLVQAFLDSVHGVAVTARALAVAGAYAAPYLAVFVAPPVGLLVYGVRRWRGGRDDAPPGPDEGDGDPPSDADESDGAGETDGTDDGAGETDGTDDGAGDRDA